MKILKLGQSLCSSNVPRESFSNKYSLEFDGVDDYVTCGDKDVFTPNNSGANRGFTVSYWVKPLASGAQSVISKNNYRVSLGSTAYEWETRIQFASKVKIDFYGNDSSVINQRLIIDDVLSVGTWYHVAFTFDLSSGSTSITGYINGVKKTNGSGATYTSLGTWAAVANTGAELLFARQGTTAGYGNIKLDEVSLFDDELSEAQVQAIYNSGNPTDLSSEPYLLGYWRNGDPTGTSAFPTIVDQSTNSNDGTMTNMASGDIVTDVP